MIKLQPNVNLDTFLKMVYRRANPVIGVATSQIAVDCHVNGVLVGEDSSTHL